MKAVHLNVGDDAWCHSIRTSGDKNNPLVKGKVVHIFHLYNNMKHYVVEFPTHVDPVLEVYTTLTVSDDPKKPIGMWRR